jgi:hypothetical protein
MFNSTSQGETTSMVLEEDLPVSAKRIRTGEMKSGLSFNFFKKQDLHTSIEYIDTSCLSLIPYQLGVWIVGIDPDVKKNGFTCNYEIKFNPHIKSGTTKVKTVLKKRGLTFFV